MFAALLALVVGSPIHLTCDEVPSPDEVKGSDFSIWGKGEYWYAKPIGQVVITRASRPGTGDIVRVGEDFGLRSTGVPGGEIGASLGDHRLRLSYLDLRFEGTEDLDQDLIFHGVTYPAGEHVRAQLDLPRFSFNYDYDLWSTAWTRTWVGIVGHIYWLTARLDGETQDEMRTYSHGSIALTASVEAFVGPVRITADGSLGYSSSSHELLGGIRLMADTPLWKGIEPGLGYWWERMDASGGTNLVALTVRGPFAALTIRF